MRATTGSTGLVRYSGHLSQLVFYLPVKALNYETLHPVRPLQKIRDDEFDSPRWSEQRGPSYDEDEYKRTEAADQGTGFRVVNGNRDHAVDSIHGNTINGVMRSQRYASGPGMEAGRP